MRSYTTFLRKTSIYDDEYLTTVFFQPISDVARHGVIDYERVAVTW